jgi:flagellar motor switch protein FliM
MANDFLSQEEVDALMRGVTGEHEERAESSPEAGIRPYNLATQERIVRGRMPTLDIINDRFARLLRAAVFNFMRRSPEISVEPVRVQKYSEFMRNLVVPTNLNIVQVRPLRGSGLFIIDPSLAFAVVDHMFGSDGRYHTRIEGRDFTPTEMRIIQRLLAVILEEYRKSWQPVHALTFEYSRSEMHTQFANIATPSEIVVTTTFRIELGSAGGALHVCIPYATLEPIRDLLYSSLQGDTFEPDRRWVTMLERQMHGAEVELVATFVEREVHLKHIIGIKAGDVIPIDLPEHVVADVDGVPMFECRFGTMNDRYAIRVERVLRARPEDAMMGEERG